MTRRWAGLAAVAAMALVAACSHNPAPAATTAQVMSAQPDTAAAALAARREQARRDSMAAAARADSVARANAVARAGQLHADSVRAEVAQASTEMRETVDSSKDVTNTALSAADAAVMAERVHFDFDRSDLRPGDIALLQQKLDLLTAHAQLVVQIAGNCDERGSEEYNLALGERRASAAKRWLVAHGIAADRISVISYGEERPLDPGHDEAAWAKNRRDDFVVTRRVS
jgi:peptidoglycan-associated lipoprotein